MNASLLAVLNDTERLLVAQTEPAELAKQGQRPGVRTAAAGASRKGPGVTPEPTGDRALRSPATEKRRASTRSMGARRQAKRDSR